MSQCTVHSAQCTAVGQMHPLIIPSGSQNWQNPKFERLCRYPIVLSILIINDIWYKSWSCFATSSPILKCEHNAWFCIYIHGIRHLVLSETGIFVNMKEPSMSRFYIALHPTQCTVHTIRNMENHVSTHSHMTIIIIPLQFLGWLDRSVSRRSEFLKVTTTNTNNSLELTANHIIFRWTKIKKNINNLFLKLPSGALRQQGP